MKKILDYQKIDADLLALQRNLGSAKEHEVVDTMSKLYKEMQSNLFAIEERAEKIKSEYEVTLKAYEKAMKESKGLYNKDVEKFNESDLNSELDKANQFSSEFFMLERKLNQILTNINSTLKEFEQTKNKAFAARNKYNEAKASLEKEKESVQPKIDELQKKLKGLEADLNKELFAKYKALKHDNIFPVFVPVKDKNCGYCRMELPNAKLDTLKDEKYIVCEQCRRLIFSAE